MKETFNTFFKITLPIVFLFLFVNDIFSQSESVPVTHPIYFYLTKLHVKGLLPGYNDMILPLSRKDISNLLHQAEETLPDSSEFDRRMFDYYKNYFAEKCFYNNKSFVDGMSFNEHFTSGAENYFFLYNDSTLHIAINPIISLRNIYTNYANIGYQNSTLITYGGAIKLNYADWLAVYFEGWNGYVFGDRETAKYDQRVTQSFSFNDTKLNFFDGTTGYIRAQYDLFTFEFGRQRILWGASEINRIILGDVAQTFDYLKFGIHHKLFSYDFLHGWLVQPAKKIFGDSIIGDIEVKDSKYIALSRLGINLSDKLNLGISQSVIYANRPAEAAYLNPFLLWESAQRSMNDLDNGFLILDGKYLPFNGSEMYFSIVLDDFNLDVFKKEKWNSAANRMAWQIGTVIEEPFALKNLTFQFDYLQVRPFTYSHPAVGEALAYTNNSNPLGADVEPNSTLTTLRTDYFFTDRIHARFEYRHKLHGANEYDEEGNLIRNIGGSYFRSYGWDIPSTIHLLDGVLEVTNSYLLTLTYYFSYNINIEAELFHSRMEVHNKNTNFSAVSFLLKYCLF